MQLNTESLVRSNKLLCSIGNNEITRRWSKFDD